MLIATRMSVRATSLYTAISASPTNAFTWLASSCDCVSPTAVGPGRLHEAAIGTRFACAYVVPTG